MKIWRISFHRDFKKMNSHAINGSSPGFLSMQQAINYKREAHNNFPYILSEEYTHSKAVLQMKRWLHFSRYVHYTYTHTLWSSRWKIDWLNRSQPREFWRVDPLYFFIYTPRQKVFEEPKIAKNKRIGTNNMASIESGCLDTGHFHCQRLLK